MIAASRNTGSGTSVRRTARKRSLLASVAVALTYMLMTAGPVLEPTPAEAQTFAIGGFRIHIGGMGGHYGRHRYGRRHAGYSRSRHARRRGGGGESTADQREPAATPPPTTPATGSASVPASGPVPLSTSRPAPQGPDFEPK